MKYLLVIDLFPKSVISAVKQLRQSRGYEQLSIIVLTRSPQKYLNVDSEVDITILDCDFKDGPAIKQLLEPFRQDIVAVICRGDKQIQFLRAVRPYLPTEVLVASEQSLMASTNKRLMRQQLMAIAPEITPKFLSVKERQTDIEELVEHELGYPVIIKPANLVSSLLIQACSNYEQLKSALDDIFKTVHGIYEREERREPPEVIIEQLLEGDLYSIDTYVLKDGETFFCPPVAYITGRQLGVDDFFLYKRFVPTELGAEDIDSANTVCQKAVQAVGLTHSTVHVELIRSPEGWKVIELGPRLGRFRNVMYKQAYGIDHSLNDVLVHLGQKPDVSGSIKNFCAAYSIYPDKEGNLKQINGLGWLESQPAIRSMKVFASPGDYCQHAKNGGNALVEFIVAAKREGEFNKLTRYIEKNVHAVIA